MKPLTAQEAATLEAMAIKRGLAVLHKVGRKYYNSQGQRIYNAKDLHAIVQVHKSKKGFLKFLITRKIN